MSLFLQEIRLKQALDEKGIYLHYSIDHITPKTIVGDKEYPLVFPRFLINADQPKTIDMLFIGLITDKRKEWLKQFPDATVINSFNGRDDRTKPLDKWYFEEMAKAKFVLCPNGDFTWTYRFFEAILCGAIPIIQNYCSLYAGYYYITKTNCTTDAYNMLYGMVGNDWTKYNLAKLEKEMML